MFFIISDLRKVNETNFLLADFIDLFGNLLSHSEDRGC